MERGSEYLIPFFYLYHLKILRAHKKTYTLSLEGDFRRRFLSWIWEQEYGSLFESHGISFPFGAFPTMAAVGKQELVGIEEKDTFKRLQQIHDQQKEMMVGFLGYDLKNQLEALSSEHPDTTEFPEALFYIPQHIFLFEGNELIVHSDSDPDVLLQEIKDTPILTAKKIDPAMLVQDISREKYIENVETLRQHIYEGDVYEINYCLHYSLKNNGQSPVLLYERLTSSSPTPFSCFLRMGDHYLVCASPERFMKKEGQKIISQPIKGTAHRSQDPLEDRYIREQLRNSIKEQAENMMIVDLVRNDLARSALTGSIKVEEMFGIYSFAYLHQMISTVSSVIPKNTPFTKTIRSAFPMGSMTGAPKVKAMKLIEYYENARRGIYSGAAGFITPEGNFDFNVVIRSLFGNLSTSELRFSVGSAITYDSSPDYEYEECQLKAKAILRILTELNLII
jgi:para-aminobenzoate synthetase component I